MTNSFALFIEPLFLPVYIEGSLGVGKIQSDWRTVNIRTLARRLTATGAVAALLESAPLTP
ncbi:hypothetical protein PMHK_13150 [Pseudomonas sp. MHK4]